MRHLNSLDAFINQVDHALRAIALPLNRTASRPSPANKISDTALSVTEKKRSAGLMRVNHAGEVCAQALYQGQAMTAKLSHIKQQMNQAAEEEVDHLSWCEGRLKELGSQPSILNPIWYGGSFLIGAFAGLIGDKVSLGFVAETELQVSKHLENHLQNIAEHDKKSKAILKKMQEDEERHALTALEAGGITLPAPVRKIMSIVAKLMTQSSYYV